MWDEIEKKGRRYQELKGLLETGHANPQYPGWLREFGRMAKFGKLWEQYAQARDSVAEAQGILKNPDSDPDLRTLAHDELGTSEAKLEQARAALVDMQINEDDDYSRNVIVEVHAGVGGDEADLWVGNLFDMYQRCADRQGWKLVEMDSSPGRVGGMNHVVFRVEGEGAFGKLRYEGGGHRVQRVPKTEAQGRIHTSMARVAVLPEAEEVDVHVDPKEVRETFCAAGGPGGQNVNKVATQCQLVHEPTGIIVHCMETRSATQNKVRAWQILRAKLYALKKAESEKARSDQRLGQIGSGDRSERVRTYNFPQGRVTDHRLEGDDKNWPIQKIMEGHLDELIQKLEELRRSVGRSSTAAVK
ncbi:MAG: PCRF domain-containing protein [Planctomycetota bacterium]|nr:PCRF domain-containing protein [Planctomycetota bacterium]